jgi:hypothetical protein
MLLPNNCTSIEYYLHNNAIKGLQREDGCAGTGSGMKVIQK